MLVEINCETDFVARTEQFQTFARDIAMHIAAQSPLVVAREEVPAAILEKEREIYKEQARATGKPENVLDRIVDGRVEKYYAEACLLEQPFVKNTDITVDDLVKQIDRELRREHPHPTVRQDEAGGGSPRHGEAGV